MKEYQEVWGCNYGVFFILDKSDYFLQFMSCYIYKCREKK